jgi:hypothetical protein
MGNRTRVFAVCATLLVLLGAACATGNGAAERAADPITVGPVAGGAGAGSTAGAMGLPTSPFQSEAPIAGQGGAGPCAPDAACEPPGNGASGADGAAGVAGIPIPNAGSAAPGGRLDPNQPTCFEFRNHGQQISGDTSKYPVPLGEQYVCNNYDVPWREPVEMVSWETLYDNRALLHHWLLYSVPPGALDGTFVPCIGTHILQDAQLVAGWAVGANDVDMPEDVGMRMPGANRGFLLEWHFYNPTGAPQLDGSGISVCVLPQGTRRHLAGMTWLGTENFNGPAGMPPGQVSEFGGTCRNNTSAPITIFRLWPHMHQWGRQMTSVVLRATGGMEQVFDMPFDFNYQISYPAAITLQPGDSIRSTCRFHNQSSRSVAFGPSSDQEMCYQFAFSYPAGALDNGVPSLVGATNTCW